MSFYLSIAKLLKNELIITKGQKLYLDGFVSSDNVELIPHWQSYQVKDYKQNYEVIAPAIHLIDPHYCSMEYFKLASCNCDYYNTMGYCVHICSVLSYLDDKYKPKNQLEDTKNSPIDINQDLWHSLIIADKSTTLNRYTYNLNNYFEYNWDDTEITKSLGSLTKDLVKYDELKEILLTIVSKASRDFVNEVKIINLFTHSYLSSQNSTLWFQLFLKYLNNIHELNCVRLGSKVYLNLYNKIYQVSSIPLYQDFLKNFNEEQKYLISQELKNDYLKHNNVWIDYCLIAEDKKRLRENLQLFDPNLLLKLAKIFVEDQDMIENLLFNHVRTYSDYLTSSNYTDFLQIFDKWFDTYGRSEKLVDMITYVTDSHPKKKSLIKELQNYT